MNQQLHDPRKSLQARQARRFALLFLACFLITWMLLITIHFLGNPDQLFPSPLNPSRREFAWKLRQFDRLVSEGRAPTVLVLGSSRMMQVMPKQLEQITGKPAFNLAAPGSTPLDMLAMLRFALAKGVKVSDVLIGVDDQAMLGSYDASHEVRIFQVPEVFAQLPLKEKLRIAGRMPAQVKPELTWKALQNLFNPSPFRASNRTEQATLIIFDDGYLTYPKRVIARHQKRWDPRRALPKQITMQEGDGSEEEAQPARVLKISQRHAAYFRALLELCRQHSIRATVVMPPQYEPLIRAMMGEDYMVQRRKLALDVQRWCKRGGARFLDCADVRSFHGEPFEFWDSNHATPVNIRRMVNVAYGRPATAGVESLPDDFALVRNPSTVNSLNTP